jgi:hypothetical protein
MDILFTGIEQTSLPPEDVRIQNIEVKPWSDGRRIGVVLQVDRCQTPLNLDISIMDKNGLITSTTSVVENLSPRIELTIHLRSVKHESEYQLDVTLFSSVIIEQKTSDQSQELITKKIIDKRQVWFKID